MRRALLVILAALAAVAVSVLGGLGTDAHAATSGPSPTSTPTTTSTPTSTTTSAVGAAPPPASLTPISCRSTLDSRLRRVSVVTVMRHRSGTLALQVRIELEQIDPGGSPQPVRGGDLGRWVSPAASTLGQAPGDVWRLAKVVYDVAAPARYRFQVEFRWLGAGGRVIADETLSTGGCAVRELTPDLLVRSVAVTPLAGQATEDRYVALVANVGGTGTGPFSVLFSPGADEPTQFRPVAPLRAGAHENVAFTGPLCASASPPTVVADPFDQVHDTDRANNTFTVTCPGAGAPGVAAPAGPEGPAARR